VHAILVVSRRKWKGRIDRGNTARGQLVYLTRNSVLCCRWSRWNKFSMMNHWGSPPIRWSKISRLILTRSTCTAFILENYSASTTSVGTPDCRPFTFATDSPPS
jgi:hypothetical protein